MKNCFKLLCLLAFLFIGCELTEDVDSSTSEIIIPSEYLTIKLDSDDLSQTITFTTTTDWGITISENTKVVPDWITVSPMSGSAGNVILSVTLDENESLEDRSANIVISTSDGEEYLSITQSAFEPTLSLSTTSKTISDTSSSFSVDVTSNLNWQTSSVPDWITLTPSSGSGDQTVIVSYTANTTTQTRSATIKFSNTDYEKEAEITITQQFAVEPTLSLSTTSKTVSEISSSFSVDVTSNLNWQTSGVPDWITLTPSSGSGDQTVTVSYTANTTTQTRSATIKFSNTDYSKEAEITVTQTTPQLSDLTGDVSL